MVTKLFVTGTLLALLLCACGTKPASRATPAPSTATAPATTNPSTQAPAGPTESPTAAVPAAPTECTDAAAFVADVTVPDYSHFAQREAFIKTWRVKNTGTCTWSSDYKAVYARGDALGAAASIALSQTAPGATLDISTNMTAPAKDGKYEIFYRLSDPEGDFMPISDGDSLWALITVGKVTAYPPASPTPGSAPSGTAGLGSVGCAYKPNADFVSQTLALINAARASNALPALSLNDKLQAAAQFHSADMACNNFLSHTGWNGSTVGARVAAAGYAAASANENIYGQPPQYGGIPQSALDWWMSDPTHRDAILNAEVTEIGIGYAYYSRSTLGGYFTVDFARP